MSIFGRLPDKPVAIAEEFAPGLSCPDDRDLPIYREGRRDGRPMSGYRRSGGAKRRVGAPKSVCFARACRRWAGPRAGYRIAAGLCAHSLSARRIFLAIRACSTFSDELPRRNLLPSSS